MAWLALLLACAGSGLPDPRSEILLRAPARGEEGIPAEDALRGEQAAAACTGFLARVHAAPAPVEADWIGLLRASARASNCLADADGDLLYAWATDPAAPPSRREAWRGAVAEWLARRGRDAEAVAVLGVAGEDSARMRVALARQDTAGAREAAEGALLVDPHEVLACWLVGSAALGDGDVLEALEAARCGGSEAPQLRRLRADALARAGLVDAAVEAYVAAGARVHAAALLLEERPERRDEARSLLADGGPAAALHLAWLALVEGKPPSLQGVPSLPAAQRLLAVADPLGVGEDVLAALRAAGDARAAVALARALAARGDAAGAARVLEQAVAKEPAVEPLHRARVALLREFGRDVGPALAAWAAQDPDHVRARGSGEIPDVPWRALAPWSWREACGPRQDSRCSASAPSGRDAVGDALRQALSEPGSGRLDALAALQSQHPECHGLARLRWEIAAPDPTRPLDVPLRVE